ncbi:MAG TPA: DUF1194 domain-containing protein [Aestuariivirgaceae bacterium]|nr:DUF1194 domain-containing protein [Aestuariivirgaceae bacterium]
MRSSSGKKGRTRLRIGLFAAALCGAWLLQDEPRHGPQAQAQGTEVDLALVLAIDCSFSVDTTEFRLQMQGLGRALREKEVHEAIAKGPLGRIGVAVFQWSDDRSQLIIIPWTVIDGEGSAAAVADQLETMPRKLAEGGTSISSAMRFGAALIETSPFRAERRVIDISSDGRNNIGISTDRVRNEIVRRGITINGLVIINEWPTLDKYFEQQVVGGPGNFVIVANDYAAYAEAIYRKLLREITGPGVS